MLSFLNSPQFLFLTMFVSLALKTILLVLLIPQVFRSPSTKKTCIYLILVLSGSMAGEIAWTIKLSRLLFFPLIPNSVFLFCARIAWALLIPQYQAIGLFLDSLTEKKHTIKLYQKMLLVLSSVTCLSFIYLAFFGHNGVGETSHIYTLNALQAFNISFEATLIRLTIQYFLALLVLPSLYLCLKKIRSGTLPKILNHQLSIIIKYLMMPYLATELLIAFNFKFSVIKPYAYAIEGISALLITYIVYCCINRIMGMRFLNFTSHVEAKHPFNFVDDFRIILEQLSFATSVQELGQITSTFFKQAFAIPQAKISLFTRNNADSKTTHIDAIVEEFCSSHSSEICDFISRNKILIYDEIAFSNFYDEDVKRSEILNFLSTINADIFLPIFEKNHIIAYVIVESNALPTALYTATQRDQMLIFAQYLGNIFHLLQHRNIEKLVLQEKELQEELYKKNQEIDQYKESIRSFFTHAKHKEIGIIFYKNRRFICANHAAKEMIQFNLNTEHGHPIAKTIRQVARQVQEYKSPQSLLAKDTIGNRYCITGVLNLEQNNVIITVSHPDIGDIITKQISVLKDPSTWDYVLYLETTKPGQLINQLIPGNGQTLLHFKISLLQTALSKKATLLELPEQDLMPMVELLHHISMRETLLTLNLTESANTLELATKLLGINPIFGTPTQQKPVLEKLDGTGTLFIQNIENLALDLQEYLAEFIKFGYYRVYKSEHKISANVRIICSTDCSLEKLVEQGAFSPSLFNELKKCAVCMPSLAQLPDTELSELAQGYSEQAIGTNDFKNLLGLTPKECEKLMENRPLSLQELKVRIQQLLAQKSKKNNIEQEIHFNPAYEITDPELLQASRLGKHALRDPKIMVLLWNKFKNQNKIATFLGVNRSSVNRRCKEYNLDM